MSEIQETQEILNKHKTESNVRHKFYIFFKVIRNIGGYKYAYLQEVRKEVVELRRSLQQSQVESQYLRGELRKAGGQSVHPAHFMEEKIQLLKEVWLFKQLQLRKQMFIFFHLSNSFSSVGGKTEVQSAGGGAGQS